MIKTPKALMLLTTAAILMVTSSVQAEPQAPRADRARVERALSAHHRPPTARQLLQYGVHVDVALREIVEEPRGNRLASNRALTTLRHFPGMETEALLERVIKETAHAKRGMAVLDLSQALPSYALVAGPKAAARARIFLQHTALEVRVAAAAALRLSKHESARALIAARLASETSPTAQVGLRRQLRLLDRSIALK